MTTDSAHAAAVLAMLRKAKLESDRGNYAEKADIVRQLMQARPNEFSIDAADGKFVGVTHTPTGFRLHLPRNVLQTQG